MDWDSTCLSNRQPRSALRCFCSLDDRQQRGKKLVSRSSDWSGRLVVSVPSARVSIEPCQMLSHRPTSAASQLSRCCRGLPESHSSASSAARPHQPTFAGADYGHQRNGPAETDLVPGVAQTHRKYSNSRSWSTFYGPRWSSSLGSCSLVGG
jgi:hypothetical protein